MARPIGRTLPFAATLATGLAVAVAVAACNKTPDAKAVAEAPKAAHFTISAEQRAKLELVTLATVNFRPEIEITGTVAFNGDRSTPVLAPISGPVSRIVANLGVVVTPGQTLATVSSPDFATAVATYRKAETALRNADRILKQNEQLFANDALARSELDQSRTDQAAAVADRDAALLGLRGLGLDEATITGIRDGQKAAPVEGAIRSPIAGTVVERLINPGQLIQAGTTAAFTVADLSSMWVIANVYADDIALVEHGLGVDIITDTKGTKVRGTVDYVAPIVDPGTKATMVRIVADNAAQLLKRDMFVRMQIQSRRERAGLLVPVAAVLRDDDNLPFVFVTSAGGSFDHRRVTLGTRVGNAYEITLGLKAGETVVANGALFLQFAERQ
jgi:cobalt-zinc-cadmium efflux system membrane fusion protein